MCNTRHVTVLDSSGQFFLQLPRGGLRPTGKHNCSKARQKGVNASVPNQYSLTTRHHFRIFGHTCGFRTARAAVACPGRGGACRSGQGGGGHHSRRPSSPGLAHPSEAAVAAGRSCSVHCNMLYKALTYRFNHSHTSY